MENKSESNTEPAIRSAEFTSQSAIRNPQSNAPQSNEILIVEDGPVEAEMLRRILVRAGYRVTLATNGEDGLKALREHPYAMVISDIQMPLMNGYEMCRAIKLDEKLWSTPVILVTMLSEPKDIVRALDVGADSYLTKPYVEANLLARINTLLANLFRRKLAEERRKVQVEYGGESYNIAVGGQQMANLLLSVYENSLILNQELMRIQNQLNLLNDSLDEKVRERTAALQESEQKFIQLFMQVPIPLAVVNRDGVMTHFNDRFTKVLGYTTEDIPTLQEWWQRAYPDETYRRWVLDTRNAAVAKAEKEGTDIEPIEYKVTGKNGAERIMLIGGVTLKDNLLATLVDITERKQAEEKFQRFFDLIPDLVCMATPDGHLLEINHMWQETLGYTKQEILSRPFFDFVHPDDMAATIKEVERQLAGEATKQFINRYRCKDGSYKWLEWETTPAVDGNLLFATARDITGRRQAETQLNDQLDELRRWHEATLGMGMRSIELKREVNELLVQAGQPPRYLSAE